MCREKQIFLFLLFYILCMRWGILILFLVCAAFLVPTSTGYDYNYYISDNGNDTQIDFGLWVNNYTNCATTEKWYYDNASYSSLEARFNDPYTTFEYYINPSIYPTTNCVYVGKDTGIMITENVTHRITMDYVTKSHLFLNTSCPSRKNNITIETGRYHGVDSLGYMYNTLGMVTASYYMDSDSFDACVDNTLVRTDGSEDLASGASYAWFIPFKATYGNHYIGVVSALIGGCAGSGEVSIYQFNDSSIVPYSQSTSASSYSAYTEVTNLIMGYDYVLTYRETNGAGCGIKTVNLNYLNITILDYEPDISCSDWSDCDNETDTKSRLCEDANGIVDSYYQYDSCDTTGGIESFDDFVFMGWSNSTTYEIPVCVPNWTIAGCTPYVRNKTISMPVDWELVSIETLDNLLAGQYPYRAISWLDLGGYKLRLWNAPPKPYEARYNYSGSNQWECINKTEHDATWEYLNVSNNTVAAQFNITFPFENSKIWFSIKKCASQQKQFQESDCNYLFGLGSLGDLCYSNDCGDETKGGYSFDIFRYNDSTFIYHYDGEALDDWRTYFFDLSNVDLSNETMYKFQFKLRDDDFTDIGTCLELREFGYGISSDAFVCESFCNYENYHYYESFISSGICISQDTGFSEICVDNTAYVDDIENCQSFCDDSDNYHVGSNVTGVCLWSVQTDSDVCEEKPSKTKCLIPFLCDIMDDSGAGDVGNMLFSITGLIYIIFGILCIGIAVLVKAPPISLIGIVFFIIALTEFGLIPSFVTAIIAILLIVLFGRMMADMATQPSRAGG